MSGHEQSTPGSQHLCDLVISLLEAEIGDAANKKAKSVCSVGKNGKFAFVYHYRDRLKIYLKCHEADGDMLSSLMAGHSGLKLSKRHDLTSDRAKLTPYYLDLNSDSSVIEAIPLLLYAARTANRRAGLRGSAAYLLPSEAEASDMLEGDRITIQVNRFERDLTARKRCVQIFGTQCVVCGFDFGRTYGEIGAGFIHVHHLTPLSMVGEKYKVNPHKDLRPVCANCHEMIHTKTPPFSIEEMKVKISK